MADELECGRSKDPNLALLAGLSSTGASAAVLGKQPSAFMSRTRRLLILLNEEKRG
jgi:hypothetical protein